MRALDSVAIPVTVLPALSSNVRMAGLENRSFSSTISVISTTDLKDAYKYGCLFRQAFRLSEWVSIRYLVAWIPLRMADEFAVDASWAGVRARDPSGDPSHVRAGAICSGACIR